MLRILASVTLALTLSFCGTVYGAGNARGDLPPYKLKQGEKEPPAPRLVKSDLARLDDAYKGIYFSYDFKTSFPDLVHTGVDLDKVEDDLFMDVIKHRGDYRNLKVGKGNSLVFLFQRYEIGDPRTTNAILEAAKSAEFSHTVAMTDFNVALENADSKGGQTKKGQIVEFDGKKYRIKDNPEGLELKRLLDAGFTIAGSQKKASALLKQPGKKKMIVSQPVWDKTNGENPIQHEKEACIVEVDKNGQFVRGIVATSSSHNHSLPPNAKFDRNGNAIPFYRNNTMDVIGEKNMIQETFEHLMAATVALGDGGQISDIQSEPWKIIFGDDVKNYDNQKFMGESAKMESVTRYHTNGTVNPNRIGTDLLVYATAHPDEIEVAEILYNEFVHTFRDELEALRALLKGQTRTTVLAIFDNQFADPHGFGLSPTLAGFRVATPFGKSVWPFGGEAQKRIEAYVYQRVVDGLSVHDPDEAPVSVVLDHNKMRVVKAIVRGIRRYVIEVGSLNLSGHFQSMERQDHILAFEDSRVARAHEEATRQFIEKEKAAGFAVPMKTGVFRTGLARLTHHSFQEISVEETLKIMALLEDAVAHPASYDQARDLVLKITGRPTTIKKTADPAEIKGRVDTLHKVLVWYATHYAKRSELTIQEIVSLGLPLVADDMDPLAMRGAIEWAVWDPNLTPEQLEERVQGAWKELGIDKPLPPPYDPTKDPNRNNKILSLKDSTVSEAEPQAAPMSCVEVFKSLK